MKIGIFIVLQYTSQSYILKVNEIDLKSVGDKTIYAADTVSSDQRESTLFCKLNGAAYIKRVPQHGHMHA